MRTEPNKGIRRIKRGNGMTYCPFILLGSERIHNFILYELCVLVVIESSEYTYCDAPMNSVEWIYQT